MGEIQTMGERGLVKLRGRDRRLLNLRTKLTAVEARTIVDAASRSGKTPSEWAREILLQPRAAVRIRLASRFLPSVLVPRC